MVVACFEGAEDVGVDVQDAGCDRRLLADARHSAAVARIPVVVRRAVPKP
jgi:hypothetical protein